MNDMRGHTIKGYSALSVSFPVHPLPKQPSLPTLPSLRRPASGHHEAKLPRKETRYGHAYAKRLWKLSWNTL
jgi:hypothetical protein